MVIRTGHDPNPAHRIRTRQGAQIREIRRFRKFTLRSLADCMCQQEGITVTSQAISEWERGESTPRQHLQVSLCRALDVPWSTIFGLDAEVAS